MTELRNIIRYGISINEAKLGYSNGLVHEAEGAFVSYDDYSALRTELDEAKRVREEVESLLRAEVEMTLKELDEARAEIACLTGGHMAIIRTTQLKDAQRIARQALKGQADEE